MIRLKGFKIFVLIGLIVIGCGVAIWYEHTRVNVATAQNQTMLTLEVSTVQNSYLQREPIPVNLKLSNRTTVPIKWNGFLHIGPDINLVSRSETGVEVRWTGKTLNLDAPFMNTAIMQPNGTKEEKNIIDENLAEKLFPQPGRYQMKIEFIYSNYTYGQEQIETVASNPITIEITEPHGVNRKAYDYLKNTYEPTKKRGNVREIVGVEQYFVDNFPNSTYWKYITYKLANTYPVIGELEKAEREFLKITDLEFYYTEQVEEQFNKLVKKLGRDKRNPKQLQSGSQPPIPRPIPAPTIISVPSSNNPPVVIPIPNPNPNRTP